MFQKHALWPSILLSGKKGIGRNYNGWRVEAQVQQRLDVRLTICHLCDAFWKRKGDIGAKIRYLHYDNASSIPIYYSPNAQRVRPTCGMLNQPAATPTSRPTPLSGHKSSNYSECLAILLRPSLIATTNEPNVPEEDAALLVPGREVEGLDLPVPGLEAAMTGILFPENFTSRVGVQRRTGRLHMIWRIASTGPCHGPTPSLICSLGPNDDNEPPLRPSSPTSCYRSTETFLIGYLLVQLLFPVH